jgi:hypothetical protein
MTTAVLCGDFHAGSETGLNPTPSNPIQKELLKCYLDAIKHVGKSPDILFLNGDLIDGEQKRGRGKGDIGDLEYQIDLAVDLVKMWSPKKIVMTTGTAYHVGGDTIEAEHLIAKFLREGGMDVQIHRKANVTINKWFRLELRHHLGSSGIPHGRHTAGARARTWNVLNAAHNGSEWPHLNVYSHVHYWHYEEDAWSASMGLPAWQAIGNRYGDERCCGHVDLGAVKLTIGKTEKEGWKWEKRLYKAAVVDRTVNL